jgi:hypothetical protein
MNEEKQTEVVQHKSSVFFNFLVMLLMILIGLSVLTFLFKITFLVAILEAIRNALGM